MAADEQINIKIEVEEENLEQLEENVEQIEEKLVEVKPREVEETKQKEDTTQQAKTPVHEQEKPEQIEAKAKEVEEKQKEDEELPCFVSVKSEYKYCGTDIKEEPPDEEEEKEEEGYHPEIENVVVKIEPTYYEDEREQQPDQENYPTLLRPIIPTKLARAKQGRKRAKSDSDEEYMPKKTKKKRILNVKKTYTTKAKKPENDFTEVVTQHIEVVTISEEERLREYNETWQNRKNMRYTCESCALGFVTEEAHALHMKNHSPEQGEFSCDICLLRARSAGILHRHRLRHHRRYRCAICQEQHKDKVAAASHVASRHGGLAFRCPCCNRGFKRPAYLKKHIAQQHLKNEHHECSICQRVFYDKNTLRSHLRTHNEEARHPLSESVVCDTCSGRFRNKASLRRHLAVHRARAEPCAHCGAVFKTKRGLRLHCAKKHQRWTRSASAQCPQCSRRCTTPSLLRLHIRRMHSDRIKKYQCDHCQRHYYSKGEVRSHIVWTHLRSLQRAHVCVCRRAFRTRARLQHHVLLHHSGVQQERSFVCHCGKGFASKQVLNRHMKGHDGVTFPCPECDLRFKSEPYVKVHYKLKHLNMTRAEIKAQREPRKLNYIQGDTIQQVPMNRVVEKKKKRKRKQDVEVRDSGISVPTFDFVCLKMDANEQFN